MVLQRKIQKPFSPKQEDVCKLRSNADLMKLKLWDKSCDFCPPASNQYKHDPKAYPGCHGTYLCCNSWELYLRFGGDPSELTEQFSEPYEVSYSLNFLCLVSPYHRAQIHKRIKEGEPYCYSVDPQAFEPEGDPEFHIYNACRNYLEENGYNLEKLEKKYEEQLKGPPRISDKYWHLRAPSCDDCVHSNQSHP